MQKTSIIVAVTIILTLALSTMAMAADDPFEGTWKLNLTKSKYNPPETAPKSQTYHMKVNGNILNLISETEPSVGASRRREEAVILDGQDHPAFIADTMASTKVDGYTISYVFKKAGKEIEHAWSVISRDGKSLISTRKRINEQGEEITTIAVYDKQ